MPREVFDFIDAKINEKVERELGREPNTDNRISLAAVDGNKLVAIAVGATESGYERYKKQDCADLMAIYIDPLYQHLGLGKKLFDKVVDFFKKQGCTKMVIGVLKENIQARKAYEKWGGQLDENYEGFHETLGKKYPVVFYLYDLTGL
jgi:Acetyltransferases